MYRNQRKPDVSFTFECEFKSTYMYMVVYVGLFSIVFLFMCHLRKAILHFTAILTTATGC